MKFLFSCFNQPHENYKEKTLRPPCFNPNEFYPSLKTQLLVLQPTPFCNISCDYCYLSNRDSYARMTLHTLRQAIQKLREDGLVDESLSLIWHAGEPLVMSKTFYEEAIFLVNEVLGSATKVSHSIQTNGTLINDGWCEFFKRHNIRVGVSLDGPAHLHNQHRKTRLGKSTHHSVMRGISFLKSHNIPFHVISVVTGETLSEPDAFFEFFLQLLIQDVSCNFDEAEGIHKTSSLYGKEDAYKEFIGRLFELSMASEGRVRIRELANAYNLILEEIPKYFWRGESWPRNEQVIPFALITVAWNGDFGTFSPELLGQSSQKYGDFVLGNVSRQSYLASSKSVRFSQIWDAILQGVKACQSSCPYFNFCGGGAPANKLYENGDLSSTETLYCRMMIKRPFDTVLGHFEKFQT